MTGGARRPLVLCYHAVSPTWDHRLCLPPELLLRQVRALSRFWKVHATFDDAFRSAATVFPALERLGVSIQIFVCTGFARDGAPLAIPELDGDDPGELATMTWYELREHADRGIAIGSHTVSHAHLTRLSDAELRQELESSKHELEAELGRPCRDFAYPYGEHDQRVRDAARAAGYVRAHALRGRGAIRTRRPAWTSIGGTLRSGRSSESCSRLSPVPPALPKRFPDREEIASARAEAATLEPGAEGSREYRIAGRVLARRDLGKLMFLDLVDRSGRIQLLVRPEDLGRVDLDLGDVIGVGGVATKTKRGEPSLAVRDLQLLGKIRTPLPDTFHGLTDTEARYRRRYLDLLMNEDARRDALVRSRMIASIRAYLDAAGFVEVETPILQPQYGGAFAEPFVTHSKYLDRDVYLRIADELYLKRLIVGGLEKVYEISKDFRNESVSYKHSPEFTQLEWYEAYADYDDTMARTEELVERAAQESIGKTQLVFRGHEIELARPWKRVRFVDALQEKGAWSRDPDELRAKLDAAGVDTTHDKTWAQLVDHAYSHCVEPELIQPTFVTDWPIEMSPFARSTDGDPGLVERFEAVVSGMEFANAFSELNDSAEQAERFEMQAAERAAGDVTAEEGDPDYVEALSYGMPPTGGCGIGMDRLAMVLTGRDTIRDVILFPALRDRG